MKKIQFLFALIVFSLGACQTGTEETSISGVVTNNTGQGLANTSVISNTGITTTTDANGAYRIDTDKSGHLIFIKEGYRAEKKDILNKSQLSITLNNDVFNSTYFNTANNSISNPNLNTNSLQPSSNIQATPSTDPWFDIAAYKGAVSASGTPWYSSWSFTDRIIAGNTSSAPLPNRPTKVIEGRSWSPTANSTVYWTKDTTYILDGFVFVDSNVTLDIQAGTIIKGKTGSGVNASSLIITQNGKINAVGTASEPIIFTYDGDQGNTPASINGQWGGLIILGRARLNSIPGTTFIEGIPTLDFRGKYGGIDDNHNSGILRYVSIRHGGSNIGADNEINGLTLGGVGAGTSIEYVEVVANQDDGIEWFGGTVNAKHLCVSYCADDALDYDEGYRGKNQFIIVYQSPTIGDRGGEHDGGTVPETGTPYATPQFWNVTSLGASDNKALSFRDNAGGEYHNSIFMNYGAGVDIEDLIGEDQDSYAQFEAGRLKIQNNIFYNIGRATTGSEIFTTTN